MSDTITTDVAVIGAGISGLTTAHYLMERGIAVEILEKSERTGGTIETQRIGGFLVDCGPNSGLDTTPLLGELFSRLGIANALRYASDAAKNRYIVKNGRLCALPMSPFALIGTPLFSARGKLRILREPFIKPGNPSADESLADFVKRRLGGEMLDYAINPFVSGVYAGVPEQLSVRASFPKLFELEQRYGSLIKGAIKGRRERALREKEGERAKSAARLFSFTDGMQTLVDAMSRRMASSIRTSSDVAAVRRADGGFEIDVSSPVGDSQLRCSALVFAIPAHAYAAMNIEVNFPAAALSKIEYPAVDVVFFGYENNPSAVPLDGFGFLVPARENLNILGTIWNSTLFSNRVPNGGTSFTTFVGGSRQPKNATLPEDRLVDLVRRDLKRLLGIGRAPDVVHVKRWPQAIPQYNVGHVGIVEAIESCERDVDGLFISGNFRGGVAIADCVRQAQATSDRVAARVAHQ